jgi:hypothetical protein
MCPNTIHKTVCSFVGLSILTVRHLPLTTVYHRLPSILMPLPLYCGTPQEKTLPEFDLDNYPPFSAPKQPCQLWGFLFLCSKILAATTAQIKRSATGFFLSPLQVTAEVFSYKESRSGTPQDITIFRIPQIQGGSDISGTISKLYCCIKKIYIFNHFLAQNLLSCLPKGNQ